jgi:hypothetical protein
MNFLIAESEVIHLFQSFPFSFSLSLSISRHRFSNYFSFIHFYLLIFFCFYFKDKMVQSPVAFKDEDVGKDVTEVNSKYKTKLFIFFSVSSNNFSV